MVTMVCMTSFLRIYMWLACMTCSHCIWSVQMSSNRSMTICSCYYSTWMGCCIIINSCCWRVYISSCLIQMPTCCHIVRMWSNYIISTRKIYSSSRKAKSIFFSNFSTFICKKTFQLFFYFWNFIFFSRRHNIVILKSSVVISLKRNILKEKSIQDIILFFPVMQYFLDVLLYLLWGIFGLINFLIIKKDIEQKIIPNKLLLLLIFLAIPIWFLMKLDFSFLIFTSSLLTTFCISFILYYFWVWSAGDAKYLLVLWLFIPHIGIISFISNIVILTVAYLCLHFIFLLIIKWIFIRKKNEEAFFHRILNSIWEEQITPILKFLKNPDIIWVMKVINSINTFLALFVLIRLSRIFIIDQLKIHTTQDFQDAYFIYIIAWMVLWMIALLTWIRIFWSRISYKISKNKWYSPLNINIFASNILFIFVWTFIYYDYMQDPDALIENMKNILTFYIAIFIAVKCLIYLYKFTFIEMEKKAVKVSKLKPWDIIYRKFLTDTFYPLLDGLDAKHLEKETKIVKNIKNKLQEDEVKALKKIYKVFSKNSDIAIIDTFAFSPYIFWWFVVTFFWSNTALHFILNQITSLL